MNFSSKDLRSYTSEIHPNRKKKKKKKKDISAVVYKKKRLQINTTKGK
jgi:hypothetical protein